MIHTERLVLRRFEADDFEGLRVVVEDKMASEWAPYDAQWPLEDERMRSTFRWLSSLDYWYAMEFEGEIIGFLVAQPTEDGAAREIGYTVRSDMQRRGFAYEACAAVMREYAKDERVLKFTAGTAECNYPSIGLLRKLGFEPKVRHRAWFKKDENGEPVWFIGYSFECPAERWRK
jgi:RimJ/RimL family protein N-acetyltransferase